MKKLVGLFFKLSLVATIIAGCSSSNTTAPGNTSTPNTSNTTENKTDSSQKEKKVVYALPAEPETLDPTLNVYSRSSIVMQNLFRGLYKINKDGQPVPSLASDTQIDETGTK
ncbi:MAG TPA: hypothetical protein VEZ13_13360, partial [Brevibacillus sp.]|nr:hypothetical protein [Brevibacillus sp.]